MGKAKRDLRRHAVVNIGKYSLVMPPLRIRSMGLLPDRWGNRKCIYLLHHQSTLPSRPLYAVLGLEDTLSSPHPRTKPAPRLEEAAGRRTPTDNGGPSVPEWLEFSGMW